MTSLAGRPSADDGSTPQSRTRPAKRSDHYSAPGPVPARSLAGRVACGATAIAESVVRVVPGVAAGEEVPVVGADGDSPRPPGRLSQAMPSLSSSRPAMSTPPSSEISCASSCEAKLSQLTAARWANANVG
jgi:hypothetical protein